MNKLPVKLEKLPNSTYIMEMKERDKTVSVSCTAFNDKHLCLSVRQVVLLIYSEIMLSIGSSLNAVFFSPLSISSSVSSRSSMHVALDMTYAELLPSLYYHDEEQVVIKFTFFIKFSSPILL